MVPLIDLGAWSAVETRKALLATLWSLRPALAMSADDARAAPAAPDPRARLAAARRWLASKPAATLDVVLRVLVLHGKGAWPDERADLLVARLASYLDPVPAAWLEEGAALFELTRAELVLHLLRQEASSFAQLDAPSASAAGTR